MKPTLIISNYDPETDRFTVGRQAGYVIEDNSQALGHGGAAESAGQDADECDANLDGR